MSTFNGIVDEFPHIRIDYFRPLPWRSNPLACFLSHVHSDHTRGLQSLRSPFVYCSSATREILLNIEGYSQRINFSKGIVETREKTYKHLSKILRPIPLGVPTEIRLTPQEKITVTLFDANHCPGSVMFLIEGNGKAILYTGDVRAERWWVDSLIRHPVLIPYAHGGKAIDAMYLDTTFATHQNIYRKFPTKAEGIAELLGKVSKYPKDTIFYLRIRTFGYEDVWQALSTAVGSKVHVNRYQWGLFSSLCKRDNAALGASEGPALCGFSLGHEEAAGCLTCSHDIRSNIHSCDPLCPQLSSKKFVVIIPIVNRVNYGMEVPEAGLGGGQDDIFKTHELDLQGQDIIDGLEKECVNLINGPTRLAEVIAAISSTRNIRSHALVSDDYGIKEEETFDLPALTSRLGNGQRNKLDDLQKTVSFNKRDLPGLIKFPFSRHSSYSELCDLVRAFRPKDVIPCTVHEEQWSEEVSMGRLFGHLCSGKQFRHDQYMREVRGQRHAEENIRSCSKGAPMSYDQFSQENSTGIHEAVDAKEQDAYQQVNDGDQPPTKRPRLDIDSSFEHSASQIIDSTTPDSCSLENIPTPPPVPVSEPAGFPLSVTRAALSSRPTPTAVSDNTQESEASHTESRKRLANELKILRDDNQLNFRLVTDSCPGSIITDKASAPSIATAAVPPISPLTPLEDDPTDNPAMSFSHPYSQTCIPCSYPKEDEGETAEDICAAGDNGTPDEDEGQDTDGKMTLSFQTAGSQSQKSVITLSTINFDSQETSMSTDSQSSKGARRNKSIEDRKRAYRAVRAGTFEEWSKVYQGPYTHEEEV